MNKQLQTKDEAIDTVQNNNEEFYNLAIELARKWVENRFKPFTSEDLSEHLYLILGVPDEPRVLGAIIRHLKREKLIKHNGYSVYKKKQGHGKPSSVWISLSYSLKQQQNRKTEKSLDLFKDS
jgi:hypothetical protein